MTTLLTLLIVVFMLPAEALDKGSSKKNKTKTNPTAVVAKVEVDFPSPETLTILRHKTKFGLFHSISLGKEDRILNAKAIPHEYVDKFLKDLNKWSKKQKRIVGRLPTSCGLRIFTEVSSFDSPLVSNRNTKSRKDFYCLNLGATESQRGFLKAYAQARMWALNIRHPIK